MKKKTMFILLFCVLLILCITTGIFYYDKTRKWSQSVVVPVLAVEPPKADSEFIRGRWVKKEDKSYYFKEGLPVTGWMTIDGENYYFGDTGEMLTNITVEPNRYVDATGKMIDNSLVYAQGREGLNLLKHSLQTQIDGYAGEWSIYVKNLDTNEYMMINNIPVQAASIAKLYNMATVYDEMAKGNLEKDSTVEAMVFDMITVSDNRAYNNLLSVLGEKGGRREGLQKIMAFCEAAGYTDTTVGSTISANECGIAPVWIATNYTTVEDCGHFLEDLYRRNLVSEEASEEMLSILKQQQLKGKIPGGLPEGVMSANKTGEYDAREHDAAIVFSEGADYVLVVMTNRDGGAISHIQSVSKTVYTYFNSSNADTVQYRIEVAPADSPRQDAR